MNKKFAEWATGKGLTPQFDAAYQIIDGFFISYVQSAANNNILIADIHVDPGSFIDKEELKNLKKNMKPFGGVAYNDKTGIVVFTTSAGKTCYEKMDNGIEALLQNFKSQNVTPQQTCKFCKQTGADSVLLDDGKYIPAHDACKASHIKAEMSKIEKNEASGSVLLGAVGAIVGALVASFILAFCLYKFESIYSIALIAIPLLSYGGYRLLNGKMNNATPFIISVVSLACSLLIFIFEIYITFSAIYGMVYPVGEFLSDLPAIFEIAGSELVTALAKSVMYCFVGIACMWGLISQSNKKKRAVLEASMKDSAKI